MDFDKMRESENVEDRRGQGGNIPRVGRGGGGARLGLGGLVIVVVGSLLFGLNPADVLNGLQGGGQVSQPTNTSSTGTNANSNDPGLIFSKKVMGDLEDTWGNIFKTQLNGTYEAPKLVLFSDGTRTGCGNGESAMGPFYCPPDQTAYLDLTFFRELEGTASAGGDLARSYVIAHAIRWRPNAARSTRRSPINFRYGSNCKRIASRASGRILLRNAASSKPKQKSRRPSKPLWKSVTITCNANLEATWSRKLSRTARVRNGHSGSRRALIRVWSRIATRSTRNACNWFEFAGRFRFLLNLPFHCCVR
jgi:Putative neutral zinc metallopeptidase